MQKDMLGKYSLGLGVFAWIWNLFAPDKLGGYQYLFSTDFSITNLKYGELWDASLFIVVGILLLILKGSHRVWWLQLGLLLSYSGKFLVQLFQETTPQTWVTSIAFGLFVFYISITGNIKDYFRSANLSIDRITSLIALVPLATLVLGWALPFSRTTYQTNGGITFFGNGKSELITDCCTAFESDWQSNVISLVRFFWISVFLILVILGIKVSKAVFIPGLYFSFYSVVIWISGLGKQTVLPDESWTQEMINTYQLTKNVTGLPGGFLFSFSLFALLIILLFPIAISTARKNQELN